MLGVPACLLGLGEVRSLRYRRVPAVLAALLMGACAWLWARSGATVPPTTGAVLTIGVGNPGAMLRPGTVGLSTETRELGSGRLSARNEVLVRLMRLLGPAVLRVGGNSADLSWWTATGQTSPAWATNTVTPADLRGLRGLLRATRWKAIVGVNLAHFEPARAADEARVAHELLGSGLAGIEIGNEPDSYGSNSVKARDRGYNVGAYLAEAGAYQTALTAAVPGAEIFGPDTARTQWLRALGSNLRMYDEVTQHYYPATDSMCATAGAANSAVAPNAAELLSAPVRQEEEDLLAAASEAAGSAGRPIRIDETGSGACRGDSAASPLFASALWSLDWSLRAASSGVAGINFHGHLGICGSYNQSPICAPGIRAPDAAQPEYYGLLAASRLEGGRFLPTSVTPAEPLQNLTIWATLQTDGEIRIALDDLAAAGPSEQVAIPLRGYSASDELLSAPSPEAGRGITFGSAAVMSSGQWRPTATTVPRVERAFHVTLRPATAMVVGLRPQTG